MSTGLTLHNAVPLLLRGSGVSLALVAASLAVGVVAGIPIGIGHIYGTRPIRTALWVFDRVFRGFPAIVLLFLVYFGLGGLPGLSIPPFPAVVLALGLRSAAYQGQILRGTLLMTARSQGDAARALGFSLRQSIGSVLMPQALRLSLPSLSNEYAIVLKDTALAFTVGVIETMSRAKFLAARTRESLLAFLAAAIVYLVLTYAGIALLRGVERLVAVPGLGRPTVRRSR